VAASYALCILLRTSWPVGMPEVAFWFQVMLCEVKIDGVNELGNRSEATTQMACWLRSRKNRIVIDDQMNA
jgi:hypothetical protein